ncbi:ABC transporter ATP-binding protein [Limnochorda pilosa]|uniref:ABC transporter n=1 Tax=Limnochorda pilosa TaxID=1555112 RepID=A0A0K2SNV0_LIMPI|nr:ATP-binding cassette domain-containing protein [Limnochorda pilosa]BAS28509.1 ABC transporter [Limnochorda pilosa]
MDLLVFKDLTYELSDGGRRIVVSGAVAEGGLLLVRGPSGSGKTTLLRVLARLRRRESGDVRLRQQPVDQVPPALWRRHVHYVAQRPVAFQGSVLENIMLPYALGIRRGESPPSEETARETLESVLLDSNMMAQDARTLSGGELARVALVRAVLARPSILLLDEPTGALDAEAREAVVALLDRWVNGETGRGLVLVSHTDDAERFSRATIVELAGRRERRAGELGCGADQ